MASKYRKTRVEWGKEKPVGDKVSSNTIKCRICGKALEEHSTADFVRCLMS